MKRTGSARKALKIDSEAERVAVAKGADVRLDPLVFGELLMRWYRANARVLPWRETRDPYGIWVSEIMLQQTRVGTVIEYYKEFLRRFPSMVALALAPEADVLAAWSGLGYYNRARLLRKAAQFIVKERRGAVPTSVAELRTLPGIGEYTAAAIASIAFGVSVAAVDGNVERVILRLTGQDYEKTTAARARLRAQAQALMPRGVRAGHEELTENAAGDHNQAMMELGATVCLPRAPLCGECPVRELCRTRGEHVAAQRAPQQSVQVACALDMRKRGSATEVLLERRADGLTVMAGMYELPPLSLAMVGGIEPALRVRHSITNTNYYVQVFALRRAVMEGDYNQTREESNTLRSAVAEGSRELKWVRAEKLAGLPLTGLARKVLQRLHVMEKPRTGSAE